MLPIDRFLNKIVYDPQKHARHSLGRKFDNWFSSTSPVHSLLYPVPPMLQDSPTPGPTWPSRKMGRLSLGPACSSSYAQTSHHLLSKFQNKVSKAKHWLGIPQHMKQPTQDWVADWTQNRPTHFLPRAGGAKGRVSPFTHSLHSCDIWWDVVLTQTED